MVAPSGEQFEIAAAGYRAVVTEGGATLRSLTFDGRHLIDGFDESEMAFKGRGQLLAPFAGRIQDGMFAFGGFRNALPITEAGRHNASHGLVRWVAWTVEEHTADSVSLVCRLMAQPGYPWTLDLNVVYDLSADGLTVTQSVTNAGSRTAPYFSGAHPYLTVGEGPVNSWELTVPAATRNEVDPTRKLPKGLVPVEGTEFDFRISRPIKGTELDHAFTDLDRDEDGRATVVLLDPETGRSLALWMDEHHKWVQLYTADDAGDLARRSLAVEPMTAQPDSFRHQYLDVAQLAPAGEPGDSFSASWGITAGE
jgi:aldose 1-epimerase